MISATGASTRWAPQGHWYDSRMPKEVNVIVPSADGKITLPAENGPGGPSRAGAPSAPILSLDSPTALQELFDTMYRNWWQFVGTLPRPQQDRPDAVMYVFEREIVAARHYYTDTAVPDQMRSVARPACAVLWLDPGWRMRGLPPHHTLARWAFKEVSNQQTLSELFGDLLWLGWSFNGMCDTPSLPPIHLWEDGRPPAPEMRRAFVFSRPK